MSSLQTLRKSLIKLEDSLIVGVLLVTLTLAVLQILLRNFFDGGIVWVEPLLRISVLWIGMVGAMFASRDDSHIKIDLGMHHLNPRYQPYAKTVIYLFTATICAIAAWYSLQLVMSEFEDNGMAFASVPVWLCEAIMPFAFTVITIRYLVSTVLLFRPAASEQSETP